MANQQGPNWATRRGQFLGTSGIVFIDQTAGDIFFEDYWNFDGENIRVAVICTSWGMSMLYLLRGTRDAAWIPANHLVPGMNVQDDGVQPPNGAAMVPPAVLAVQAGAPGVHIINGQPVSGLQLPWHRRITVTRGGQQAMHYHQTKRRVGHVQFVLPEPKADGKSVTFNKLTFGTQVSNYRRVQTV